ncbi:hypothetical protein GCM10022223_65560 [Kineosporia mesophila]|uniref:Uncharacterized protein n=1 Tax=Kineosporia mesophila TaxID=566012 RepID=A0ABP7APF2_9ACTN|nr:Uma2 family endonuclease [Kineosporia mesophila]
MTSPGNPDNDRERKYRAYARGGVQQCLLIDPVPKKVKTATLFTQPVGDEYTKSVRVLYGECLTVEYPVPIVINTREFPLHDGD